ncbi:SRPBCC family protein [Nocardioides sp. ChNu-153]|uniref:SRPBCC family protein n=1 Tax=unclassified Nocardioides TaxID=2615069 RepID=UPI002404E1ED|nr:MULTISPECIES: SRPBCC family protein [unclassified Nocardioides]MDF9716682.1 SRPBCC family protein [Nocardioides sp. ChNu-99]MDN7121168.1 SRPBCC family protein [Nocardioides sp. ChNu-153]
MTQQQSTSTELEATTDIDASPAQVWALVSDLPRMAEWSPQVVRTFVPGGVRLGATMINLNHRGLLVWPTRAKVVRFDPQREIAFRVAENRTIWSYRLVPHEGGTRLVHRRETPDGISKLSIGLTTRVLGGVPQFTEELRTGMARTLAAIKKEAERA